MPWLFWVYPCIRVVSRNQVHNDSGCSGLHFVRLRTFHYRSTAHWIRRSSYFNRWWQKATGTLFEIEISAQITDKQHCFDVKSEFISAVTPPASYQLASDQYYILHYTLAHIHGKAFSPWIWIIHEWRATGTISSPTSISMTFQAIRTENWHIRSI